MNRVRNWWFEWRGHVLLLSAIFGALVLCVYFMNQDNKRKDQELARRGVVIKDRYGGGPWRAHCPGVAYFRDARSGLCFAQCYVYRGGAITYIPCTDEVLGLIVGSDREPAK